ncbi:MAG: hypothetical protein LQ340_001617 [Diploschistes diacapsis]|nr:MAG: hypothetical protein LQ340_001617 [Diploschistes diacapsis]
MNGRLGLPSVDGLDEIMHPLQRLLSPSFPGIDLSYRNQVPINGGAMNGNYGIIGRQRDSDTDELAARRAWQDRRERDEQRRQQARDDQEELEARRLVDSNWTLFKGNPQFLNVLASLRDGRLNGLAGGINAQHAPPRSIHAPRDSWGSGDEDRPRRRHGHPRRPPPRADYASWDDEDGLNFGRRGVNRTRRAYRHHRPNFYNTREEGNSVLDELDASDKSSLGISGEDSSFGGGRGRMNPPYPDSDRAHRRQRTHLGSSSSAGLEGGGFGRSAPNRFPGMPGGPRRPRARRAHQPGHRPSAGKQGRSL